MRFRLRPREGKTLAEADIEADGAYEEEAGPTRRCLVTRQRIPRETGLRFVAAPDGNLVFDAGATLPGRGLWLSPDGDVIDNAVRRGVLARAAKTQLHASVTVPADLRTRIEAQLTRRLAERLGLARRGGGAVSGFDKVREWLAAGKAGLIVQAADGSRDEKARLAAGRSLPAIEILDAASLGRIFGRERAVHVAVAPGKLAAALQIEARRLAGVAALDVSGQ